MSISTVLDWENSLAEWVMADYDFDPTLRCEYGNHFRQHLPDDPAKYLVRVNASCGCVHVYLMCQSGYDRMVSRETLHCHTHGMGHLYNVKILETLNV